MVDYSLVILSCDKYKSLWEPFVLRLDEYWPSDASSKRYIVTNHIDPKFQNIKTISIGDDLDWSSNVIKAISTIDTKYIYLLLEDTFLKQKVSENKLNSILNCLFETNANYINTKAVPMPRGASFNQHIREVANGSHYRASLCNAFWKKDILIDLLRSGETAWEFEKNGSIRSNKYDKFYGTTDVLFPHHHIIIGGKVANDVLKLDDVKNSSILKDFKIMSKYDQFKHELSIYRNITFSKFIPQSLQQKIRKFFK